MFMRRRIRPLTYWVLFFFLLIPTTINETKVTVIFLPLGLLATLLLGAERGKKLKYFMMACAALVVAAGLFIPIYNFTQRYNPYKNEKDITAFFTNEKALGRYLSSDVGGVGTKKDVRRGDAIVVPFEFLAKDPVKLAFGLGLGAVSPSTLGPSFEGEYYSLFQKFSIISFTFFLLELGVFGIVLIGALFWMMFSDTLAVARQDRSLVGVLATGWTGVVVIFALDVVYTIFHEFASVTYLYWYFAGLICARCVSLAKDRVRGRSEARILT
jgi:4-amino-4-deoxy-L-arabinose transferase-like glycosyltransferase